MLNTINYTYKPKSFFYLYVQNKQDNFYLKFSIVELKPK